jgi:predicted nucleic acid-binding Zn finger protein
MYKSSIIFFLLLVLLVILGSCKDHGHVFNYHDTSKIEFRKENGMWRLYRNNEPYEIKGAHGIVRLDWLKEAGGNSILIYENELSTELLDEAHSLGLTVSVTLDIAKARFFNYRSKNKDFIIKQRARIREVVEKYHTHPAILFWIVGNELHIGKRFNVALWREVNEISRMIHEIDPYHPTTTTIAAYPTRTFDVLQLKLFAPDLDFLSLTVYEFAPRIRRETQSYIWGINGPFLVTEWGGTPYWMYPRTEWDAIIEHSSTRDADMIYHNHFMLFDYNPEKCIGGYVFYWGQKQERTHTVFSLILEEKYKTQSLEALQYIWTGTYPDYWAPRIDTFMIEGFNYGQHYLEPDTQYTTTIIANNPDQTSMRIKWALREEGYYRGKTGGEAERIPDIISMSDTILPYRQNFNFKTPEEDGQYRLFVYVYNDYDYVATANIPLYVMP